MLPAGGDVQLTAVAERLSVAPTHRVIGHGTSKATGTWSGAEKGKVKLYHKVNKTSGSCESCLCAGNGFILMQAGL